MPVISLAESSLHFKIHRGTKEIGGSCVEVWTDTSRIVLDMGMPLVNADGAPFDEKEIKGLSKNELIKKGVLPDIPWLYKDSPNTALLISHAHQDHYGLMNFIDPSCPVWLGFGTQLLIELTNTFTGKGWVVEKAKHLKNGKKFKVGDMEITPYLMDHAAFDAYAFLVEANGKSLFYSGDFRLHGRKKKNFEWFCSDVKKPVDYLLLEGTTIGRTDESFPTEEDLEEQFVTIFKRTKGINLIYVSGQNIERLKTIYKACSRCHKIFLIDFYIANVLRTLNKKVDSTVPFPSRETYPDIKVYYPGRLTKWMKMEGKDETVNIFTHHKIGRDEIDKMANQLVMIVRPTVQSDLEQYLHKYDDGSFIYSIWGGYKNKPGLTKDFIEFISSKNMPIKDIHTSGHADLKGLKRLVEAVKPKHIVPIHTFKGNKYAELFEGYKVVRVNDKEDISI